MLLPAIVFFAVAGLVVGGYWALLRFNPSFAGRHLEQRLRELSLKSTDETDNTVVINTPEGPMPVLDRAAALTAAGNRLALLIERSGVKTTPSAILLASLAVGVLLAACAALLIRVPFAPVVAGLLGLGAPFVWLTYRASARLKKFEEQFPEALDLMARAIRAGHAFQTALGMVADELTDPVGPEFKKTFERQNFGLPLREAMNELAERIAILDVRFFVTAVTIQRETGGNLAEILENLAHVVRERFKIRRQVRVHTAHGRFTGYVLLALPAALAVALSFIAPDQMTLLFRDPMGRMMVGGAIVMQTIGFIWIRQIIKIEV
jgi:tight adherence protein B